MIAQQLVGSWVPNGQCPVNVNHYEASSDPGRSGAMPSSFVPRRRVLMLVFMMILIAMGVCWFGQAIREPEEASQPADPPAANAVKQLRIRQERTLP